MCAEHKVIVKNKSKADLDFNRSDKRPVGLYSWMHSQVSHLYQYIRQDGCLSTADIDSLIEFL